MLKRDFDVSVSSFAEIELGKLFLVLDSDLKPTYGLKVSFSSSAAMLLFVQRSKQNQETGKKRQIVRPRLILSDEVSSTSKFLLVEDTSLFIERPCFSEEEQYFQSAFSDLESGRPGDLILDGNSIGILAVNPDAPSRNDPMLLFCLDTGQEIHASDSSISCGNWDFRINYKAPMGITFVKLVTHAKK